MSLNTGRWAAEHGAATANHPDLLVDPRWIANHLGDPDVRVVEVDVSAAAYQKGHVPGAILWNAYADLRESGYRPIGSARFAELLATSGISPQSTVVFYGYGAYLGFWLMKRYRHDRAALMDGPRERWERAGQPWSVERPAVTRSRYPVTTEDETVFASLAQVSELITCQEAVIIDVRSSAEYTGERFWPSGATADAGRAGHIPGAVHVPIELVRDEQGLLKHPHELRALYENHGVAPHQRVVTYCTIGNRASQVWFTLRHVLHYPDVSVYYGSWVEWGNLPNVPIQA